MFISTQSSSLGEDSSDLDKGDELLWHQLHTKAWRARDFEGNVPVALCNITGREVPLTWILLDSQLIIDIIDNPRMLVNI